ncbi:MAG TPA: hypothetical protein VKU41_05240 [Polyangiaceae bacterium]|nr:hypothetical protein [Polyangiaceae bacterium]
MRRVLRRAALVGGLVVAVAPTARAGEDAATATREAQARFDEGLARLKGDHFEAARISFQQAYAVLQRPSILWNLALAEEKSGHFLDALGHFRDYVRLFPSDDDRIGAQRHYDALMAQTGHIDVQAPVGTQVTLDGAAAGTIPLSSPLDVLPGKHRVEGRNAAGVKGLDVDAAAGQVVRVSLGEPSSATGALAGASPTGQGSLDAPAAKPTSAPAEAQAPEPPPPRPDQAATPPSRVTAGQVATVAGVGGLGLVAIGVGVSFAFKSRDEANVASGYRERLPSDACAGAAASQTPCPAWNAAVQSENRDATWSNVMYVTGGVLVAGAVATWFLWPQQAQAPVAVAPVVGAGTWGLTAHGRFE